MFPAVFRNLGKLLAKSSMTQVGDALNPEPRTLHTQATGLKAVIRGRTQPCRLESKPEIETKPFAQTEQMLYLLSQLAFLNEANSLTILSTHGVIPKLVDAGKIWPLGHACLDPPSRPKAHRRRQHVTALDRTKISIPDEIPGAAFGDDEAGRLDAARLLNNIAGMHSWSRGRCWDISPRIFGFGWMAHGSAIFPRGPTVGLAMCPTRFAPCPRHLSSTPYDHLGL